MNISCPKCASLMLKKSVLTFYWWGKLICSLYIWVLLIANLVKVQCIAHNAVTAIDLDNFNVTKLRWERAENHLCSALWWDHNTGVLYHLWDSLTGPWSECLSVERRQLDKPLHRNPSERHWIMQREPGMRVKHPSDRRRHNNISWHSL